VELARAGPVVPAHSTLARQLPIQRARGAAIRESHPGRIPFGQSAPSAPLIFPALLIATANGQDLGLGSRQRKEQVAEGSAQIAHMSICGLTTLE
jgi:hypothetical protein